MYIQCTMPFEVVGNSGTSSGFLYFHALLHTLLHMGLQELLVYVQW